MRDLQEGRDDNAAPAVTSIELLCEKVWSRSSRGCFVDYVRRSSGSLNDYARKSGLLLSRGLQGTGCYDNAATAMNAVADRGIRQGLLADGSAHTGPTVAGPVARRDVSIRWLIPNGLPLSSSEHKQAVEPAFQAAVERWPATDRGRGNLAHWRSLSATCAG